MTIEKQLYNLGEYAQLLGIERHHLAKLIRETPEKFAPPKVMGKKVLYWIEDIHRKLAEF